MKIKFNKLKFFAHPPYRKVDDDAGNDLHSTENLIISPSKRALVGTGISIELPVGTYGRIAPRSGLAVKNGIDILAGVIDSTYRGEIKVALINFGDKDFEIKIGDRIAQLIVENYIKVQWILAMELTKSERMKNGFGSSGV